MHRLQWIKFGIQVTYVLYISRILCKKNVNRLVVVSHSLHLMAKSAATEP